MLKVSDRRVMRLLSATLCMIMLQGCGYTTGTWNTSQGVTIRVYRPILARTGGGSFSSQGKITHYAYWVGVGGRHRIEFAIEGTTLVVDGREYGAVQKDDFVEIYQQKVLVNGVRRSPRPKAASAPAT